MKRHITVFAVMILMTSLGSYAEEGYALLYAKGQSKKMFNLGPTGIWGYGPGVFKEGTGVNPDFFVVDRAEGGSPAHGFVRKHDVITGVNGQPFSKDVDPRIDFAFAIEDSEAKDGKLNLQITRGGIPMTVTLTLEKIPAYSPAWPFNCERTDVMLKDACEYLKREQMPEGDIVADDGNIGPTQAGLLWLAAGEPRYLQNAIRAAYWYKEMAENGKSGWCWTQGYGGLLLAEYYNMTGDKGILPGLENIARILAKGQMPSGGWSHGGYSGFGAGYGEVNCAGMICYMALLEARDIGVKVDHEAIAKAEAYFEKFAPTLSNQYGDHNIGFDKLGYRTLNGKVGGVAVAHWLNGKSEYSKLYALKGARSVHAIESGHTGHFFNAMWTPIAASLAPAKEYRSAMDQLAWYFTLSRHWRGGLFCQPSSGAKYSKEGGVNMTTGGYGLVLALPRRHLRILGAPVSVFARKDLPAELEAARKLHQSNQWDAAIKAVDVFLEGRKHDKETVRLANELRDKSQYVKAGIEEAYVKLEELASGSERGPRMGSRPFKASGIIRHLRLLLGEDDARLKEIEATFPEKFRGIWRHGETYHEAFRTLRSLNTYNWFIFSSLLRQTIPDFAMPADYPTWAPLVKIPAEGASWKAVVLSPGQKEPENWTKMAFDDSDWGGADKRIEGMRYGRNGQVMGKTVTEGGVCLARVPFELNNVDVKELRVLGSLSAGAKVYINGACVLDAFSGVGYREKVRLLDNTRHLLKNGTNMLAISSAGNLPGLVLDAVAMMAKPFNWTPVPGRDAEILKVVGHRRVPAPYYRVEEDQRTPDELMATFETEPFFMPEAYYALNRFHALLPDAKEKTPFVERLLKSKVWGARWAALCMVEDIMKQKGNDVRALPAQDRAAAEAENEKRVAANRMWAEQFAPQVVKLLSDPHPQVRNQAARMAALLGSKVKDGIPALEKLLMDPEGQNWFVRAAALDALASMPMEEEDRQCVIRAALNDPNSTVRANVLGATFRSKDPEVRAESVRTYKEELIDQIFDAPHGMFTKATRSQMATIMLEQLTKDEIRPHLPRFFESLERPYGHQLDGSIAVLVGFGDEVRPKLKELAESGNLTVRYNAVNALLQMTTEGQMTPERLDFVKQQIEPLLSIDNGQKASTARKWLEKLETGNWETGSTASVSEPESAGGGGNGSDEGEDDE